MKHGSQPQEQTSEICLGVPVVVQRAWGTAGSPGEADVGRRQEHPPFPLKSR